jgi:predicted DNA-binding transcriptional regulator YafY
MALAGELIEPKRGPTGASWGQERRLEFIEFRLLWDGRINRGELVEFFGISIQQASLDLARYMDLAPGNLEYDKSHKAYKASRNLRAMFTQPDAQAFLNQLSSPLTGPSAMSFIGWRPPCDVVNYPTRSVRTDILMRMIWAIRDRQDMEISYQSMRRPDVTRRWVFPHAIAFDGFRWHARAWCHENHYFKDFVLARIQDIHRIRRSEIDPGADARWHSFAYVILRANRHLAPAQRIAVETEFGMKEGELRVRTRESLVHYLIRQLSLDRGSRSLDAVQLLEWVNQNELEHLVAEATSR